MNLLFKFLRSTLFLGIPQKCYERKIWQWRGLDGRICCGEIPKEAK